MKAIRWFIDDLQKQLMLNLFLTSMKSTTHFVFPYVFLFCMLIAVLALLDNDLGEFGIAVILGFTMWKNKILHQTVLGVASAVGQKKIEIESKPVNETRQELHIKWTTGISKLSMILEVNRE